MLAAGMTTVQDKIRAQIAEFERLAAEARSDLAELSGEAPPLGLAPHDILAAQAGYGERYPTGFPTLDENTRGGIPRGRLVTLVGQPGVGKTSIAIQMALTMARNRKAAVCAIFADGGIDDAAITMAQQLGVPRDEAEEGRPSAVELVRRETFGQRIDFIDPSKPYSFEEVAERFVATLPQDVAPVLILDSAQRVHCPNPKARTIYERVTATSNAAQETTKRLRLVTLLVSQSKRALYANRQTYEDEDPLASGAGSGQLEYDPDLHLFVQGGKGKPQRMVCGKSRIGRAEWSVELAIDFARHRHYEVDQHAAEAEREGKAEEARTAALRAAQEAILTVARRNPEGLSTRRLEELCGGQKAAHREARRLLWESGGLLCEERSGRGGGSLWKAGRRDAA